MSEFSTRIVKCLFEIDEVNDEVLFLLKALFKDVAQGEYLFSA